MWRASVAGPVRLVVALVVAGTTLGLLASIRRRPRLWALLPSPSPATSHCAGWHGWTAAPPPCGSSPSSGAEAVPPLRRYAARTGAVELAEAQTEDGQFTPAIDLAREIAESQTDEIETMQELLDGS